MTFSEPTSPWRWGLNDEQIELLREFRASSGRRHAISSSTFLEFIQPNEVPQEHEVMEFLWGYAPLYHTSTREPLEDLRGEIADLIRFLAGHRGWEPRALLAVCADEDTFRKRWQGLYLNPVTLWLEELRSMLELRGLPSSIPPLDPADPYGARLADVRPGIEPLASLEISPQTQLDDSMTDAAAAAPALGYVASLIEIASAGVRLTENGNLSLAGGKALAEAMGCGDLFDQKIGDKVFKTKSSSEIEPVDLVFRWARTAGFVRAHHGKLVPTKKGRNLGGRVIEDWWELLRALVLKLHWIRARHAKDRTPFWAGLVDDCTCAYLSIAAGAGARGVATLSLADATWALVEQRWITDDLPDEQVTRHRSFISSQIRRGLFIPLELLGCAETWDGAAHGAVKMSPLGVWAVRRLADEVAPPRAEVHAGVVNLAEWRARN